MTKKTLILQSSAGGVVKLRLLQKREATVIKLMPIGAAWTEKVRNKYTVSVKEVDGQVTFNIRDGEKLSLSFCDMADLRLLLNVLNRECPTWFEKWAEVK